MDWEDAEVKPYNLILDCTECVQTGEEEIVFNITVTSLLDPKAIFYKTGVATVF